VPTEPQGAKEVAKRLRDDLVGKTPAEKLQSIMLEIADEADVIRDSRHLTDDPTIACQRRIVALKEIGNLVVQLDKLGEEIDVNHPILQVYCNYLMDIFQRVMISNGLAQGQIQVIFSSFLSEINGKWQQEVQSRYSMLKREKLLQERQEEAKKAERKSEEKEKEKLAAVAA